MTVAAATGLSPARDRMRPSRRPGAGRRLAVGAGRWRRVRARGGVGRGRGGDGRGLEGVAIADARRDGWSPLRAGSNVNWRTASSAAASSASPAEPTTFASVSLPSAAIVSSRSTAAPSGGVASGPLRLDELRHPRRRQRRRGRGAASGVCADARGAARPLVSSASALATSFHFFDLVPGISASAGSLQPKSCQRASPRNRGPSSRGRRPRTRRAYNCPRGHATAVRSAGAAESISPRRSGGTRGATPPSS